MSDACESVYGDAETAGNIRDLLFIVSLIDLTSLEPTDTPERIGVLCSHAARPMPDDERVLGRRVPPTAAVCVWPALASAAREAIDAAAHPHAPEVRRPRVAAVAGGFPAGQTPTGVKTVEARLAVEAGADEIDLVINRGRVLAGRVDSVAEEVDAVRRACPRVTLKVILETGDLADADLIRSGCDAAISAGADFLKTSTGKSPIGATPRSVRILLEAARDERRRSGRVIGVKPSGGVRSADQAVAYLRQARDVLDRDDVDALGPAVLRFGASGLLDDIVSRLRGRSVRKNLDAS